MPFLPSSEALVEARSLLVVEDDDALRRTLVDVVAGVIAQLVLNLRQTATVANALAPSPGLRATTCGIVCALAAGHTSTSCYPFRLPESGDTMTHRTLRFEGAVTGAPTVVTGWRSFSSLPAPR